MTKNQATDPPLPGLPGRDSRRGQHTREREALLSGDWHALLLRELSARLGATRAAAVARPDMSSNVLRSVSTQLAVLYDRLPTLDGSEVVAAAMRSAGYWQIMSGVQRMVIGLNQALVSIRPGVDGLPLYRYVSPGMVTGRARPESPAIPEAIKELRLQRPPETDALEWVWECWDSSPRSPSSHIEDTDGNDITARYARDLAGLPTGALVGDEYPYHKQDGTPVLPYVLYHAQRSTLLFDGFRNQELYEGSLAAAVGWTCYTHCLQDASWPQRYTINCIPAGASAGVDSGAATSRHSVVSDPSTILILESTDEGGAVATAGQWKAGSDPAMLADTLTKYEARLAAGFGISPSDIQRMGGAAARSGYAISIKQAAKRENQQKFIPHFARSDISAAVKTAAIMNSANPKGARLPESGYRVTYRPVPMTAIEREAARRHVIEMMDRGLMSRVDALIYLEPELTRERAKRKLVDIGTQRLN